MYSYVREHSDVTDKLPPVSAVFCTL